MGVTAQPKFVKRLEQRERDLALDLSRVREAIESTLTYADSDEPQDLLNAELDSLEAEFDELTSLIHRFPDPTTWHKWRAQHEAIYEHLRFEAACRSLEPDIGDVFDDIVSYLDGSRPDLHWRRHEEGIQQIFQAHGFQAELGPGTGDGGVDLRLIQKSAVGELLILVQAKRYDPKYKVGLEAVQALYGAVEAELASKGVLVTTSSFLPSARRFAETRGHRLLLADHLQLRAWIDQVRDKRR